MRGIAAIALLLVAPAMAWADELSDLGIPGPGFGVDQYGQRPSYRQTYDAYPPPQRNILGQPEAPPSPYDRPSYRQTYDDYPPPAGRYGGGFVEYVITGGHAGIDSGQGYAAPSPLDGAPSPAYESPIYRVYPPPVPAYAATGPSRATHLPRSGLPEYLPNQPPAYYQGPQSMALPAPLSPLAAAVPAAYATAPAIGESVVDGMIG